MLDTILIWSPRILVMLLALWLSVFALDVFDEKRGFWKTALAFVIHLVPTWVILAALALAWRWEWVGAILFCAIGLGSLRLVRGKRDRVTVLTMFLPPFAISVLFLASWLYVS
jgi:hypothetical protein